MAMSVGDEHLLPAASGPVTIGRFRYLRAPRPLHFPVSADVPESKLHLKLRTLLFQLLEWSFAKTASIGCDQFVYWDPTDPRACLSPDAFVRLGRPDTNFKSWKVWEHGAPELAIEVISDSEHEESWEIKLHKYARLGVRELVSFDPQATGTMLRVWDWVENDLVERELSSPAATSNVLPGHWVVANDAELGPALRLSRDGTTSALFPTRAEAEAEGRRAEGEALRASEARIRELEAELARR